MPMDTYSEILNITTFFVNALSKTRDTLDRDTQKYQKVTLAINDFLALNSFAGSRLKNAYSRYYKTVFNRTLVVQCIRWCVESGYITKTTATHKLFRLYETDNKLNAQDVQN